MGKISNLYQTFFSSREKDKDEVFILDYIQKAIQSGSLAFDANVAKQYINNPQFIEQKIIDYILNMEKIHLDMEFLSIYREQMNATSVSYEENNAIILDELLTYTALSFFLTVFSLAYDSGMENFSRCIKNCFVLLDLQGQKHKIGVHSPNDIELMISLPTNIINLAMDSFWAVRTFMIGHELYHLTAKKHKTSGIQEELSADSYGYKILIKMIESQKMMNIPEQIKIFYEEYYLAPIMLFEYFRFLDHYRSLCGEKVLYIDYPSPQQRQEHIFSLFDDYVPDTFDTTTGNEILNLFLDTTDLLLEQISLKKERGKLDFPIFLSDEY